MDKAAFDIFWQTYPKKRGKGAAVKRWKKLKPDAALQAKIMEAVRIQSNHKDWKKDGGQYIPFPATWLNRGMWDDEVDVKVPGNRVVACAVTGCKDNATNTSSTLGLWFCPPHSDRQWAKNKTEAIRKDG